MKFRNLYFWSKTFSLKVILLIWISSQLFKYSLGGTRAFGFVIKGGGIFKPVIEVFNVVGPEIFLAFIACAVIDKVFWPYLWRKECKTLKKVL